MKIVEYSRVNQVGCGGLPDAMTRRLVMLLSLLLSALFLPGCVSYQFFRAVEGREVVSPCDALEVGKATLGDVLLLLGAPDKVVELEGKDLLLYETVALDEKRLTFGIPVADVLGANIDLSAYGTVARYDTLACFFTPDGILQDMVFEKGSSQPYLRMLFSDK
jgi:hypothetical protein